MTKNVLCPFFRKNEDDCDVGWGYISPHDVKMMVDYCSSRYTSCARYQQLAARFPEYLEIEMEKISSVSPWQDAGQNEASGGHG